MYDAQSASTEVVRWDRTHGLVAHLLQVDTCLSVTYAYVHVSVRYAYMNVSLT